MERIRNAWELAKASWQVLSRDRELIAVPVVAAVAAVLAFGVIAGPGVVLLGGATGGAEGASDVAMWVVVGTAVVVATWVTVLGQAAVVSGAAERMDGGDPTLASVLTAARGRAGRLLGWAVLATAVSVVLDQIEQRLGVLGRVISWIGGVAFRVMSFLALPVIVFEDVGAIEAFRRSSSLLKRTWGEQVAFNFGLGLLGIVAALPGIAVGALLVGTGVLPFQALGGVTMVAWVGLVAAVTSALSAVFKAALYRYANDLPVDPAFDEGTLGGAFHRR